MEKKPLAIIIIILGAAVSISIIGSYFIFSGGQQFIPLSLTAKSESKKWTEEFNIEDCNFSTTGNTTYMILQVGYQLILNGTDEGDVIELNITVLNEIENVGGIDTRVVQELEKENGEIIEISRNYFAICNETQSVFYFGENVSEFEGGIWVSDSGAWRADEPGNEPGIIMPGLALIGARYYQEIAPGVAMDRAEIMDNNATITVDAGTFEGCLIVRESNPLEGGETEYKYHAPGIGLIIDEVLELQQYGFL